MTCACHNVDFGTYANTVSLPRPDHMKGRKEGSLSEVICIDTCIAEEIKHLWSLGIRTTGCCCGHNKQAAYIGVIDEDIPRMKALGYSVQFNPMRPDDEDTFDSKTITSRPARKT